CEALIKISLFTILVMKLPFELCRNCTTKGGHMLKTLSLAIIALFLSISTQAEDLSAPYFEVQSVEVQVSPVSDECLTALRIEYKSQRMAEQFNENPLDDILNPIKDAEKVVDAIINLGAKIWKVFEASTPVVNLSTRRANALPRDYTDWREMSDWSDL